MIWGWRFKSGNLALLIQLSVELSDELLGVQIHLGVDLLGVLQRERRVRHSQLPHRRGPPEPRQRRHRRSAIRRRSSLGTVVQHLEDPLENIGINLVYAAVVFAFVGVVEQGGAVAAAELVVVPAGEDPDGVFGAAGEGGVVVVEHEVAQRLAGGEFATL